MKHRAFGIFLCTLISSSCPVFAQYAGQLPAAEPVVGHENVKIGSSAPKASVNASKTTASSAATSINQSSSASERNKQPEQMKVFEPNSGKLASISRFGASASVEKKAKPTASAIQMPMPKGAKKGHWVNTMSMSGMPLWVEDP